MAESETSSSPPGPYGIEPGAPVLAHDEYENVFFISSFKGDYVFSTTSLVLPGGNFFMLIISSIFYTLMIRRFHYGSQEFFASLPVDKKYFQILKNGLIFYYVYVSHGVRLFR